VTWPFARRGGHVRWTLEPWEQRLLRSLRDDIRDLLEHGDPGDRVLARLNPRASSDAGVDRELRGLMRDELLTARLAGLDALVDILDRAEDRGGHLTVDLRDDEPALVLGVANDLRLALGARLGIEDLDRAALAPDDPAVTTLAVMDHLAVLQEALLEIIDPPSLAHYEDHDE
jgi:hypothetical protein